LFIGFSFSISKGFTGLEAAGLLLSFPGQGPAFLTGSSASSFSAGPTADRPFIIAEKCVELKHKT